MKFESSIRINLFMALTAILNRGIQLERRFRLHGKCRKIVFSSSHCSKLSSKYQVLYIILWLIYHRFYKKTIYFYFWHCIRLQQTKTSKQLRAILHNLYWDLPNRWLNIVETKSGVSVLKNRLSTLSIQLNFVQYIENFM